VETRTRLRPGRMPAGCRGATMAAMGRLIGLRAASPRGTSGGKPRGQFCARSLFKGRRVGFPRRPQGFFLWDISVRNRITPSDIAHLHADISTQSSKPGRGDFGAHSRSRLS
jgi:hypothetical protein